MIKAVVFLIVLMLKIIGVLLLFGLLLLTLLLFVPVRYSVKGENSRIAESLVMPETEGRNNGFQVRVQVNVSWFLHFIHYSLDYGTSGVSSTVRIFGIDIQKLAKKFKNFKNRKKQERRHAKKDSNPEKVIHPDTNMDKEKQLSGLKTTDQEKTGSDTISQEDTDGKKEQKPAKKRPRKKKGLQKKKRLHKKKNLHKEGDGNKNRGGRKRNRIHSFYNEFTDQANRRAVFHLWKELLILLRSFKPRRIKADLAFSLADPAFTGYLSGLLSMFPFFYRYPCHILPDFNSQDIYVEGEIFAKGKITVVVFLLSLFRLWRDKEVIYVFKRVAGRS